MPIRFASFLCALVQVAFTNRAIHFELDINTNDWGVFIPNLVKQYPNMPLNRECKRSE